MDEVQSELARDRLGNVGLADAGWAVQQDAVPLDSVARSVVGVLQDEPDRVADLLLQRLHPADVVERRQLVRVLNLEIAAATAEAAHHPPAEDVGQRRLRLRGGSPP